MADRLSDRLPSRLPRLADARALVPRRLRAFPFTSPTWPSTVARPPEPSTLGAAYDSEWARTPVANTARRVLQDGVVRPVLRVLGDPEIHGRDRIDELDGPAVFVANHGSHLDTGMLLHALPAHLRRKCVVAAAGDYFFDTRLKAVASSLLINAIPIDRKRVSRTSSDRAIELLRDGWNLIVFPEGGRSPDGWGQEHKPGAAFIAIRAGVPVVPVHLHGTRHVLPKDANRPHLAQVTITFGDPIVTAGGDDPRALSALLATRIDELGDEQRNGWWAARRRAADGATPSLRGSGAAGWRRAWELGAPPRGRRRPERAWP